MFANCLIIADMCARADGLRRHSFEQYGTDARLLQATCAQSIGCIGQRSAALGLAQETSLVLSALLNVLSSEELPVPSASGQRSKKWLTKENACLGVVTVSSSESHSFCGAEHPPAQLNALNCRC